MSRRRPMPGRGAEYGDAVRAALVLAWEASDRICGKRLHPLLPLLIEAMERHGHGGLDDQKRQQLLAMSAATIDRICQGRQGERHGAAAAQGLNGDQTECPRSREFYLPPGAIQLREQDWIKLRLSKEELKQDQWKSPPPKHLQGASPKVLVQENEAMAADSSE